VSGGKQSESVESQVQRGAQRKQAEYSAGGRKRAGGEKAEEEKMRTEKGAGDSEEIARRGSGRQKTGLPEA